MVHAAHTEQQIGRSDLVALGERGPFRLTLHHSHGVIVEYFPTTKAALCRQVELEDLLAAAQGFSGRATRIGAR